MKKDILRKYAEVLVKVGINLTAGETVIIVASPTLYNEVRAIAEVCYECGAKYVKCEYEDFYLRGVRAMKSTYELSYYPNWLYDYYKEYAKDSIAIIELRSPFEEMFEADSDKLLKVLDGEKRAKMGQSKMISAGDVAFVKTNLPGVDWAKKVYPELSEADATKKLFDNWVKICRLDREDPVQAWEDHKSELDEKKKILNSFKLKELIYKSDKTDLKVGLVEGGFWIGGYAQRGKDSLKFVPNIPTEEVFFVPHKLKVNGIVSATLPLQYQGNIIEDIKVEFKDGKVVSYSASKGKEFLDSIINFDEGSCYLGEVALVSAESPIYKIGKVFYDTLWDENASCHIAFGQATPSIIPNGYMLTEAEKEDRGINRSGVHVDFMIGDTNLTVKGVCDNGEIVTLMENGIWAI